MSDSTKTTALFFGFLAAAMAQTSATAGTPQANGARGERPALHRAAPDVVKARRDARRAVFEKATRHLREDRGPYGS